MVAPPPKPGKAELAYLALVAKDRGGESLDNAAWKTARLAVIAEAGQEKWNSFKNNKEISEAIIKHQDLLDKLRSQGKNIAKTYPLSEIAKAINGSNKPVAHTLLKNLHKDMKGFSAVEDAFHKAFDRKDSCKDEAMEKLGLSRVQMACFLSEYDAVERTIVTERYQQRQRSALPEVLKEPLSVPERLVARQSVIDSAKEKWEKYSKDEGLKKKHEDCENLRAELGLPHRLRILGAALGDTRKPQDKELVDEAKKKAPLFLKLKNAERELEEYETALAKPFTPKQTQAFREEYAQKILSDIREQARKKHLDSLMIIPESKKDPDDSVSYNVAAPIFGERPCPPGRGC